MIMSAASISVMLLNIISWYAINKSLKAIKKSQRIYNGVSIHRNRFKYKDEKRANTCAEYIY